MKVTVFGIGYVGLVQAAVLAEVGHDVVCVDIDLKKVDNLNRGILPIYETGLEPMVKENSQAGRLHFTQDAAVGITHSSLQFIAVGTPAGEDGSADLQYVLAVASQIAEHMNDSKIIVNKSTVPVGTADKVALTVTEILQKRGVKFEFSVASNPEFLKEGAAVIDCMRPDRIIVGIDPTDPNKNCVIDTLKELYAPFNRNHDRMIFMDVRSSELTKYAANCMLATKISFMNEMACLAEQLGADIEMIRKGIGADPRIGFDFIYPGCGYGGSCFPKDIQALAKAAEAIDFEPLILTAVEKRNSRQKDILFTKIARHFNGELEGRKIALWGLAFKPDTNDMRDAPSRVLMESLWMAGVKIQAYDPEAMEEAQLLYGVRDDLILCGTAQEALKEACALVICTEWLQFRAPNFDQMMKLLKNPVIFDGRNIYEPERMIQKGFIYYSIGR